MSYDSKIQSAKCIIEQHNQNATKTVDFEKFRQELENMGGTTEQTLSQCKWEDLERFGVPVLISREIAKVFRQSDSGPNGPSAYVSPRKAEMMTIPELLERYDSSDVENSVGKRLIEIAKGKKCIVFMPDGTVNVEKSSNLLFDIKKGYPDVDIVQANGVPSKVYRVGENPNAYADENPLYPGQALRSDSSCGQTMREWKSVPLKARQILYLARTETKELVINRIDDAHTAIDLAMGEVGVEIIRRRYPKASVLFDQKEKDGDLPLMRIPLISSKSESKSNDPFYRNNVKF